MNYLYRFLTYFTGLDRLDLVFLHSHLLFCYPEKSKMELFIEWLITAIDYRVKRFEYHKRLLIAMDDLDASFRGITRSNSQASYAIEELGKALKAHQNEG